MPEIIIKNGCANPQSSCCIRSSHECREWRQPICLEMIGNTKHVIALGLCFSRCFGPSRAGSDVPHGTTEAKRALCCHRCSSTWIVPEICRRLELRLAYHGRSSLRMGNDDSQNNISLL